MASDGVRKFWRAVIFWSILLVILYVGAHLLARTEGVRKGISDKLSGWVKLPVHIEHCSLTPMLQLNLRQLTFSGVSIDQVQASLSLWAYLPFSKNRPVVSTLELNGATFLMRQDSDSGYWRPVVLHQPSRYLSSVLGVPPVLNQRDDEGISFPSDILNEHSIYILKRAKVVWYNIAGDEIAYLADADSIFKNMAFDDRSAIKTIFSSGHTKLASGELIRDLNVEVVKIEGYDPTLVLKLEDHAGKYDGFQTASLRQDLKVRLEKLAAQQ